MVVAANCRVGAEAVREPPLLPFDRHGERNAESGVLLLEARVSTIRRDATALPVVGVPCYPETRAKRVNQMPLDRHDRRLFTSGPIHIVRVVSEKQPGEVPFERPAPFRVHEPELRPERPAIRAEIDVPGRYVLTTGAPTIKLSPTTVEGRYFANSWRVIAGAPYRFTAVRIARSPKPVRDASW